MDAKQRRRSTAVRTATASGGTSGRAAASLSSPASGQRTKGEYTAKQQHAPQPKVTSDISSRSGPRVAGGGKETTPRRHFESGNATSQRSVAATASAPPSPAVAAARVVLQHREELVTLRDCLRQERARADAAEAAARAHEKRAKTMEVVATEQRGDLEVALSGILKRTTPTAPAWASAVMSDCSRLERTPPRYENPSD